MRTVWQLLEKARENKMMVRLGMWPGGRISVGIYNNQQSKQYLFECDTFEQLEKEMTKELKFLIGPVTSFPVPPTPPGFPKL